MAGLIGLITFAIYSGFMIITLAGIPFLAIHLFLIFAGAGRRAAEAEKKVKSSLMDGESIVAIGIEKRAYSLFSRRKVIAVTDSRVLTFKRNILGGFKMVDVQWKDVVDAELSQNIIPNLFGSTISVSHSLGKESVHVNIPCEVANTIYRYSQKQEQSWEEKRRIRTIEEARASSGSTYITTPSSSAPESPRGKSIIEEIKEAKEMLQQGIISDAEFEELKSRILMTKTTA